jgi:hypothetical protein
VRRRLTALIAAGAALAGCSSSPSTPTTSTASTTSAPTAAHATPATAARTHELPTPAGRPAVAGGWATPVQAVQQFTVYYINWSAPDVVAHLRALATVSVGQARSSLALQAAETARDYELRRGGIVNRGEVEAIGRISGSADRYAVVTREQTSATNTSAYAGLAPAWHVALATVARVRGLWVLSGWQPES